jgi:hypothetical protein
MRSWYDAQKRGHRGGPAVCVRSIRRVQGTGARRGAKPKVSRGAGHWEGARRPWERACGGVDAEAAGAARAWVARRWHALAPTFQCAPV